MPELKSVTCWCGVTSTAETNFKHDCKIGTGHVDLDAIFAKCLSILRTKGADYSEKSDRLSNFKIIAKELGTTPLIVLTIYLKKHTIAVDNFIKRGKLESEPIEDRIADVMNYYALMHALIMEMRRDGPPT